MSAESPRHARSGGPLTVPPQPPTDRSLIDAVSGFISDVTLSASSAHDPKDVIQWARFETADINEPTSEESSDTDISPLLLVLGYGAGVQVWLVAPSGEAQEVLSWRQGSVRVLRILPTPLRGDCYTAKRPLIALCDSASPGPPFCSLSFISIRGGEQVKSIKFKNPILDVLANKRSVVISFSERFAVFDAGTLEDRMAITTCYPCPCPLGGSQPINPLAIGDRWLAYADKKLNQSKRSSGGCESEGVTSYTATVLHAAKSLGKGLRGLGESVAHSLAGRATSQSPSPPHADLPHPGVVTVIDIENNEEEEIQETEESYEPIVAHFVAHSEPIIALKFDPSGMLLVTADRRGHDFHVFRINPHPCGPALASVHHLYVLHRGDTTAKVQDIAISGDSRWAAISTLRGTTHIFAMSPYGGGCGVRTHTAPRVLNRLSRFQRSAGLPIHPHKAVHHTSGSPVSDGKGPGSWFPNPRLPPYPAPTTNAPLAQLRPTAAIPTHTITRTSSGRQRLSSLSEDNSAPLLARARFGPPIPGAGSGNSRAPSVAALYLVAATGCLSHIALHTRPARGVPKEKICDDTPIELDVEPVAQWALQRPPAAADLLAPLPPTNPLLQTLSCRRCADSGMSLEERWLSQVEIVTHAGPHRRLWMGPQFVFKTYTTGSSSSLSEAEAVEVEAIGSSGVARSTPVNVPAIVPVMVDSGSPSSLEHSPSDSFRRKSVLAESGRAASVCDVQLKEDLAEAMKEENGGAERREAGSRAGAAVERAVDPLGWVVCGNAPQPPPQLDPDPYTADNADEARFRPVVRAAAATPLPLLARPLPRTTTIPVQTIPLPDPALPRPTPLPAVVLPAELTTNLGPASLHLDDDFPPRSSPERSPRATPDMARASPAKSAVEKSSRMTPEKANHVTAEPSPRPRNTPERRPATETADCAPDLSSRKSPIQLDVQVPVNRSDIIESSNIPTITDQNVNSITTHEPISEKPTEQSTIDAKAVKLKPTENITKQRSEPITVADPKLEVKLERTSSKSRKPTETKVEKSPSKSRKAMESKSEKSLSKSNKSVESRVEKTPPKDELKSEKATRIDKSFIETDGVAEQPVMKVETKISDVSKLPEAKVSHSAIMEPTKQSASDAVSNVDSFNLADRKTDVNKDLRRQENDECERERARDRGLARAERECEGSTPLPKSNEAPDDIHPAARTRFKKSPTPQTFSNRESDLSVKNKSISEANNVKASKDVSEPKEIKEVKEILMNRKVKGNNDSIVGKNIVNKKETKQVKSKFTQDLEDVLKINDACIKETKPNQDSSVQSNINIKLSPKIIQSKREEDEIKTEEQAWDMLLSEPKKSVVHNVSPQSNTSDKNDDKPKSKRNKKSKKVTDDATTKNDDDSFIEIHAIEKQPFTDELVSISEPLDANEPISYAAKAKKSRISKSCTPEKNYESESIFQDQDFYSMGGDMKFEEMFDVKLLPERSHVARQSDTPKKHLEVKTKETFLAPLSELKTYKSKSLSPFGDHRKTEMSTDKYDKDVYVIDSTQEEFPEIQITKANKMRKRSPQQPEVKQEEKELADKPPVKSWSSIAASKNNKKVEIEKKDITEDKPSVIVMQTEAQVNKTACASDEKLMSSTSTIIQEKLTELCKRTDIMIAQCDVPSELNFVEEHHSILHDLPPLEPLDFALDDFKLEVMRDSLIDVNEMKMTSPICKINIDDILSSIKETTAKAIESSAFSLIDLEKVPAKKERGFRVIEDHKIKSQDVKLEDDLKEEAEVEKSSDEDGASPVVSTDSDKDDKKAAGASNSVLPSSKQLAKSKKSRRKKK